MDDVLVVGGGIIGLSVARALAKRGLAVHVVDRPRPGEAATRAAAGMLSPLSEASEAGPFLSAGLASLERYPAWIEELGELSGLDPLHRPDGKLRLALDDAEAARIDALLARAAQAGVEASRLGPAQARAHAGVELGPFAAAVLLRHDHQVDNRRLHEALLLACRRSGVRFSADCEVSSLLVRNRRVEGVSLADGSTREADEVVLAAGAWSGSVPGLPFPLPVRPVRGQMLALDAGPALPPRVVESGEVYLVPRRDGRLLVGATVEEVGFEAGCTADARKALLSRASRLLPALEGRPVLDHWCGFRPGTPDGNPIVGRVPGARGLTVATGHFRNGILLAPWTGAAIARLLAGGGGPDIPADFRPDRFRPAAGGIAREAPAHHPSST